MASASEVRQMIKDAYGFDLEEELAAMGKRHEQQVKKNDVFAKSVELYQGNPSTAPQEIWDRLSALDQMTHSQADGLLDVHNRQEDQMQQITTLGNAVAGHVETLISIGERVRTLGRLVENGVANPEAPITPPVNTDASVRYRMNTKQLATRKDGTVPEQFDCTVEATGKSLAEMEQLRDGLVRSMRAASPLALAPDTGDAPES